MFEAHQLTKEQIDTYWPMIVRELDRIPHTWNVYWTKDFLYQGAMVGMFEVWASGPPEEIKIVLFTQIVNYPANKILQAILILGNSLEEAMPSLEAVLTRYAQVYHATVMEVTGRPGWEKKLSEFGLRKTGIVLSKAVHEERLH